MAKWSLRNRLLVAVLVVAAIGIGTSDFFALTSLRSFLTTQIDTQLNGIMASTILRLDRAGMESSTGDEAAAQQPFNIIQPLRGVPNATSVTLLDARGVIVGKLGGDLTEVATPAISPFSGFTSKKIAALGGKAFTIQKTRDQVPLRAVALELPSGIGSVVVATSLEGETKTLGELSGLFFFISLIVLVLIGLFARLLIQISLKPLREVEVTAAAIAGGDLSARLPESKPTTEVGRLTQSLNTMLGRIEESFAIRVASESRLRRFAADASHELRTPLTAIRGFAELYRQGAVSGVESTKELVGRIESESIRMSTLVEDLLLLARMDQAPTLAKEPLDLNQTIRDVVASAEAAGPLHPIEVDLPYDESFILGDPMRVHQVIANLLANARTHTPEGTKISIRVNQSEKETMVSVSDNGPGLSSDHKKRIFERFFRADPSRARTSGEGSGLGLSIVDAVMKAHGGSVSVESEVGKGSTFTLHFPIAADE
jgi:two-component system OmpR family sensor kinase